MISRLASHDGTIWHTWRKKFGPIRILVGADRVVSYPMQIYPDTQTHYRFNLTIQYTPRARSGGSAAAPTTTPAPSQE